MTIEAARLQVRVETDARSALSTLRNVEKQAKSTADALDGLGKSGDGLSGAVGGASDLLMMLPGIGTAAGLAGKALSALSAPVRDVVSRGFSYRSMWEQAEIGFTTMLGSAEAARKQLGDLATFAEKTPFEFPDTITGARRLMALGFAAKDVIPMLTAVGDATAALGGNADMLDRMTMALGQMRTKGKVSAEEMMQLAEAGVPAWELLAKAIGKTVKETMKLSEAGRLDGAAASQLIAIQLEKRYAGLMARQSATLQGRQSSLQDIYNRASGTAVAPLYNTVNNAADVALQKLSGGGADKLANGVAGILSKITNPIDTAIKGIGEADLSKLGMSYVEGIVKGLEGGKEILSNAGTAISNTVTSAVDGTWQINSPSKVAQEQGFWYVEGLEQGMIDRANAGFVGFEQALSQAVGNATGRALGSGGRRRGGDAARLRDFAERMLERPEIQAAIDAIGKGEGTFQNGQRIYNKIFGGRRVGLTPEHPQIYVPFTDPRTGKRTTSSAAGVGQFLAKTWRGVDASLGGLDFNSPHDQLLGMVELMRQRGMITPLLNGQTRQAFRNGKDEWASLPGSPYKQPTQNESKMLAFYQQRLGLYQGGGQPSNAPVPVRVVSDGGNFRDTPEGSGLDGAAVRPRIVGGMANADPLTDAARAAAQINVELPTSNTNLKAFVDAAMQADSAMLKLGGTSQQTAGDIAEFMGREAELAKQVIVESEEAAKRLRVQWDDVATGFESVFVDSFSRALDEGENFFSNMLVGFTRMVAQMQMQAMAAQLSKALFGYDGTAGSAGGGWLGKLLGWGISAVGGAFGGGGASAGGAGAAAGGSASSFFGGLSTFSLAPRASGGRVWAGRTYWVGEEGRETFTPDRNGYITANDQLDGARGGRTLQVNNHFHVTAPGGVLHPESQRQMAARAALSLQHAQRRS